MGVKTKNLHNGQQLMGDEAELPEGEGGEGEGEGEQQVIIEADPEPALRYCYSIALLAGEGVKIDQLQVCGCPVRVLMMGAAGSRACAAHSARHAGRQVICAVAKP